MREIQTDSLHQPCQFESTNRQKRVRSIYQPTEPVQKNSNSIVPMKTKTTFVFKTERTIRAEKFNRTLWIIRKVAEICLIATPHTPTTPFMHPLVQLNQLRYNTEDIHIHYPDRCSYPGCLDDVIGDPHGFESYCIHHYNYIDPNR
jgi:hypothetical protein